MASLGSEITVVSETHTTDITVKLSDSDAEFFSQAAAGYATKALQYRNQAETFATSAQTNANIAGDEATAAHQSALNASASAQDAATSATNAGTSETNAGNYEANALSYANSAQQYMQSASNYSNSAGLSRAQAQRYATNASQSASDAQTYAESAQQSAQTASAKVAEVTAEGTRQIGLVSAEGTAQVSAVQSTGSAQISAVQSEGTTQKNAVIAQGQATIASIPADYTTLSNNVTDVKSALNTFTGFEKIVFTNGGYINTSGNTVDVNTVVTNSSYRYAVVDCSEGDEFTITGLGGSTPRLWCFINSAGDVLSKAYDTESRTDYVLTAPENSAKLILNDRSNGASYKGIPYTMPDVEAELNAKIDKTDADLADLADITTTVDWDSMTATVQTGIAYNTDNTGGTAWSGANSYIYTIVPGGVYKVSTTVVANAKYYAVLFYNDTTYLSGEVQGIVGTRQDITNHEFSAPLNANTAIITTYSAVTPSLVQKTLKPYIDDSVGAIAPNYVKYDGTTLTVKCRYNTSEDLVVQMKKRGNNSLFDFDSIFTVSRTDVLDGNVSSVRNILTANTDCFSPHQIKAVNNADGDSSDIFLTGGNHNHNNVATAVCQNVKVYVDGEEVTDVSRLAGEVVVTWQNLIQAYNTWKSDGSGRAVLQEDIRLEIHRNTFNAIVAQTALEDIDQAVYYGLQSIDTPYQTICFVGGDDRTDGAINTSRNSGNLTSRRTIAKNATAGDALETHVDDIDLGTFSYTGDTYSIFTANNKCYYAVLRNRTIRMSSGANYYLYGGYKFYSLT